MIAGSSILFLQNLKSKFAGRVVVEVARSAARDHQLGMNLDVSGSSSSPEVLSVSMLDQVYRLTPLPPTSLKFDVMNIIRLQIHPPYKLVLQAWGWPQC